MSDDPEKPESGASEAKPPTKKAEDNPWYLLATLYGVPASLWGETEGPNDDLRLKNRIAWNRYFAPNIYGETQSSLIAERRYSEQELTEFSDDELVDIEKAFAKRSSTSSDTHKLPPRKSAIDFSGVIFDRKVFFDGFLFTNVGELAFDCSFKKAIFSQRANFANTIFLGCTDFKSVIFSGDVDFLGASFFGGVDFKDVAFLLGATFWYATFSRGAFFQDFNFHGRCRLHESDLLWLDSLHWCKVLSLG